MCVRLLFYLILLNSNNNLIYIEIIEKNQFNSKILVDNSPSRLDISEYLNVNNNMKKNGCIYITLIEINPIIDMSYIFGKC